MAEVIELRFQPLVGWPHQETRDRRYRPFRAGWHDTLAFLTRELGYLDAENVLIGVAFRPQDLRLDGWPRVGARTPLHPGVEISFDSGSLARLDPQVRRGRELIQKAAGDWKEALRRVHPDLEGGDGEDVRAINAARDPARRLVYATDVCTTWQDNVRSIAFGLEALRAVDRYGISRRGEQYAGYRAALTAVTG